MVECTTTSMVRTSGDYAQPPKSVNGKVKEAQEKHDGRAPKGKPKVRLDWLLVERGLAESREQAQKMILAGRVVHPLGQSLKPGMKVPPDYPVELIESEKYVSRGGYKLEAALNRFGLDVAELVCMDIGASTGGFTDCLLQRGARLVYAVDVGVTALHPRLRSDPRVRVLDHTNARYLSPEKFEFQPSFVAIDVSFISGTKILPAVVHCVTKEATAVALLKPQFEAGRADVSRGRGVLRDPALHSHVLRQLLQTIASTGGHVAVS
ncbi:MAG: TlyA family RNA methyltransferase, partial [Candidatus Sumerlaeaceae bacterium]|nr:TlyA family RNA methyltransferase [Candidatus Sumerlaeaceae bacterium]